MKTKILLSVFLAFVFVFQTKAQWINKSFTFESKVRQYRIYIPVIYSPANPASLVIMLHGAGDNITTYSNISGINLMADTANFIVLFPQALDDPFCSACWNSGAGIFGYYPNASINDVGFLNAMIDTTIANYSINQSRMYICGVSMGGFMTERMACESNNRIAAFASVAGTIGQGFGICNPGRAIPIAHFHGTNDSIVGYYNNDYGINTDSLIKFWIANNQCDTQAIFTNLPDVANDGYTIENFVYKNGLQNTEVELYKVNGANHVWLNLPQNDISYSIEIWKFFNKHKLQTSIESFTTLTEQNILVYPNPSKDNVSIEFLSSVSQPQSFIFQTNIEICNINGQIIENIQTTSIKTSINLNNLNCGIYIIKIITDKGVYTKKLVKQ